MSKLEQLIEELCPDGVEYRELNQICKNITTGKLNANSMVENGIYPFYTCDALPFRINEYAFDTEAILISGNGSRVGHINYYNGKFNAYQRTYVLSNFNDIEVNFLLHYLKEYLRDYILIYSKKGSIPYITLPMLQNFKIPLPPLPVQREIVRILDNLTELTKELIEELAMRKKQYEYYRDSLLNINNKLFNKKIAISKLCLKVNNVMWGDNTDTEYDYIDLSSVNIDSSSIIGTKKITKENAPSRAKQIVKTDDVLFGTTRPTLKRYYIVNKEYNNQICSTGFCVLRPNKNLIISKYLFFIISSYNFYDYVDKNQEGASYPAISNIKVKDYKIPLPPLEEQQRIVDILDRFDTLCNDISKGLPAEIEARKKQYEYYRDKLLIFKKKEV